MASLLRFLCVYFILQTFVALIPIIDGPPSNQSFVRWIVGLIDDAVMPFTLCIITYVLANLVPQKLRDK